MFKQAIVRTPGKSMVYGLSTAGEGPPNYKKALIQHENYIQALESCGLEVVVLPPDEEYPDSTFVEDTALLTPQCAIITNPGAPSRRGETAAIKEALTSYYTDIEEIQSPGTIEGGDIMMVGRHFFIGLSARTNLEGARQMIGFLKKCSLSGSVVTLEKVLHLKTSVAYLEHNNLVASGEFVTKEAFRRFNILTVDADESYAANCIWVNGTVLMPYGYPKTKQMIERAGYPVMTVDVSEFKKLDGGVSCLSLRF
jgi:dimethylargininase